VIPLLVPPSLSLFSFFPPCQFAPSHTFLFWTYISLYFLVESQTSFPLCSIGHFPHPPTSGIPESAPPLLVSSYTFSLCYFHDSSSPNKMGFKPKPVVSSPLRLCHLYNDFTFVSIFLDFFFSLVQSQPPS